MTQRPRPATQALRLWGARQWGVAALAGLVAAVLLGLLSAAVPELLLGREDPAVGWWPAWLGVSLLTGVLVASYVVPVAGGTPLPEDDDVATATVARAVESAEGRSALLGAVGAVLLVAGSVLPGAGVLALVVAALAVLHRLSGQAACPVNAPVSTAKNSVVPPAPEAAPEG
ncbi:hypothetical protein ACT4S2_09720 [Kocuria turfanensis]|uniref:hypothetical protein n=1 Tax=Kocuria turfanensis TaxID=388357 RepID=UPI004036BD9F